MVVMKKQGKVNEREKQHAADWPNKGFTCTLACMHCVYGLYLTLAHPPAITNGRCSTIPAHVVMRTHPTLRPRARTILHSQAQWQAPSLVCAQLIVLYTPHLVCAHLILLHGYKGVDINRALRRCCHGGWLLCRDDGWCGDPCENGGHARQFCYCWKGDCWGVSEPCGRRGGWGKGMREGGWLC